MPHYLLGAFIQKLIRLSGTSNDLGIIVVVTIIVVVVVVARVVLAQSLVHISVLTNGSALARVHMSTKCRSRIRCL